MPKLRRLSGPAVVRILENFGFLIFSQRGSHIKLRRITETGEKQILTIVTTQHVSEGVAVDYAADGKIAGIEILDAIKSFGSKEVFKKVTLEDLAFHI